jgi:hypothetical protein
MAQEWANAQDDNGSIGSSDQQEQVRPLITLWRLDINQAVEK